MIYRKHLAEQEASVFVLGLVVYVGSGMGREAAACRNGVPPHIPYRYFTPRRGILLVFIRLASARRDVGRTPDSHSGLVVRPSFRATVVVD